MCYNRINTEIILANLIAAYGKESKFTNDQIENYLKFLSNTLPGYVSSDFCIDRIRECAEEYPQLYNVTFSGCDVIIKAGDLKPNIEFFNKGYSPDVSNHIEKMTSVYITKVHGKN